MGIMGYTKGMEISFTKLNHGYESDPNSGRPIIEIYNTQVILKFELNHFIYGKFEAGQFGEIMFDDCSMFRVGDPNLDGLYRDPKNPKELRNDTIWNRSDFPDLEAHTFFQVEGSDWQHNFGPAAYVNKELSEDDQEFKHFLFIMKDGTFECVARGYRENIPGL